MVSYTIPRLRAGIPGTVHRMENAEIATETMDPTLPVPGFGLPVVIGAVNGRFRPVAGGDADANVYGILVRSYPGFANPNAQGLGQDAPLHDGKVRMYSVMIRGFINVKVNGAGAPTKMGPVYVRIAQGAADPVAQPVGGIEAAADGANTIQLGRSYFRGPADAYGNTEIAFRI